jgi:hypothetical protein
MTYVAPSQSDAAEEGGTVLRRPRITDAIGAALRRAYGDYARLPTEWQRSLDALDRYR